jgi:hypothetical protein
MHRNTKENGVFYQFGGTYKGERGLIASTLPGMGDRWQFSLLITLSRNYGGGTLHSNLPVLVFAKGENREKGRGSGIPGKILNFLCRIPLADSADFGAFGNIHHVLPVNDCRKRIHTPLSPVSPILRKSFRCQWQPGLEYEKSGYYSRLPAFSLHLFTVDTPFT